ncbi:hypothetical protein CS542_01020 [Pedobacter sp. IW39]|nr:hypothetical protein CS542_01020 [Pedobacter sp. IW39]
MKAILKQLYQSSSANSKAVCCAHVPFITLCNLCYMAIRITELRKLLRCSKRRKNYRNESDSSLVTSMGLLIVSFHTDKPAGWNYLERYLPWALECEANLKFSSPCI